MHKLDRSCISSPVCLDRYRHGRNTWDDIDCTERQEIRTALEAIQGRRCAYCECNLDEHGQHIEHFHQRSRHPRGTFDWDNLFWSCDRDNSCGKHKDKCGVYNAADLIKPDAEDPEHFFQFVSNGSIALRPGLSTDEQHRATETLRIFNLDAGSGPLRRMRELALLGHIKTLETLNELREFYPSEDIIEFIEEERAIVSVFPFCTAIKHYLKL